MDKLAFEPGVVPALLRLQAAGYRLVMITNQDGLGTDSFPQADFDGPHNLMMQIFTSQGIAFDEVLICPHKPEDHCDCRKPATKLVEPWLQAGVPDKEHSYVIGDRQTDIQLAENMGIKGIRYGEEENFWPAIAERLTVKIATLWSSVIPKKPVLRLKSGWIVKAKAKSVPVSAFLITCWIRLLLTAAYG